MNVLDPINSIENYIKVITHSIYNKKTELQGKREFIPWFRGEYEKDDFKENYEPLVPKVYRKKNGEFIYSENKILQHFRFKAPILHSEVPNRSETDKWLYLAQHVGLPTRLLDWTESALVALYFSLYKENSREHYVWMLDPLGLNALSANIQLNEPANEFPLPWHNPENQKFFKGKGDWDWDNTKQRYHIKGEDLNICIGNLIEENGDKFFYPHEQINIGNINIRGAWEKDKVGIKLPVAIIPTRIHPRMSVQKSCFTVHGTQKGSLAKLAPKVLNCYRITPDGYTNDEKDSNRRKMIEQLNYLGISHSTLFPDLDGLAMEMQQLDYYKIIN